jgi:hypothetical protein
MGQTKKIYEQMTTDELLNHFFNHNEGDEDYQYELYRERQLEAEQEAYELHLTDKY